MPQVGAEEVLTKNILIPKRINGKLNKINEKEEIPKYFRFLISLFILIELIIKECK
jgi:hypothetical protein